MPTAYFFVPYKRRDIAPGRVALYPAVNDFNEQIEADGGAWREKETLGGYCIVKVRASVPTLQAINAAPGVEKIPIGHLNDPTGSMTQAQRTGIIDRLNAIGFSNAEISAAFPQGWDGPYALHDIITFAMSRRQQVRYDEITDTVVWNGIALPPAGKPDELQDVVADDGATF